MSVNPGDNILDIMSKRVSQTEDGLALEFARQYKDKLKYCHTRRAWFEWDGSRWKQEQTAKAFHWARLLCRKHNSDDSKKLAGVQTASAVEKFARADRCFAVTDKHWNKDFWLLATPAGTVDLRTGETFTARPADNITLMTSTGPAAGRPEKWLAFLDQSTGGNPELIRFLQQIAGYCLTGLTREHALFFLYGSGGNGKGVFVNTLMRIMDEYATAAPMSTFTSSKFDSHPTDLADLAGSRMVTASETDEGRSWAEARIKQMSGGDPIKARFMRQDFFQYQPQFKLVFLGNHKPVLVNVDDAARRRFNIIPFTYQPKTPDLDLEDKLKAEHGQILQWMIDGCLDWQAVGLTRPAIVTEATTAYFSEQDLFAQWLDECTEKASERVGERTTKLFSSWKTYAENAGDAAGTQKSFREKLDRAGYEYLSRIPGDRNGRGYVRIRIIYESDGWCSTN